MTTLTWREGKNKHAFNNDCRGRTSLHTALQQQNETRTMSHEGFLHFGGGDTTDELNNRSSLRSHFTTLLHLTRFSELIYMTNLCLSLSPPFCELHLLSIFTLHSLFKPLKENRSRWVKPWRPWLASSVQTLTEIPRHSYCTRCVRRYSVGCQQVLPALQVIKGALKSNILSPLNSLPWRELKNSSRLWKCFERRVTCLRTSCMWQRPRKLNSLSADLWICQSAEAFSDLRCCVAHCKLRWGSSTCARSHLTLINS